MTKPATLEDSYLALVEFLMLAKQRMAEIGQEFELTGMQSVSLLLLSEPRPMHFFTKFFNCDPSNITGIIDALEAKDLVARVESPSDRRIKNVSLLAKGTKTRTALLHKLTSDSSYPLSKLTSSESTNFIKLVQKITHG